MSIDCTETLLAEALQAGDIAVCIKDARRRVLMQDEKCRRICGDQRGRVCEEGCMALYARDEPPQWKDWGARVYTNGLIHGSFHDVTLLRSRERIITFLQPLRDKYEKALAYYRDKGLTRRESEVITLTIRGITNSEICKRLSISRATLRTHLNNVYRKFRDLGEMPEFIPAKRISG